MHLATLRAWTSTSGAHRAERVGADLTEGALRDLVALQVSTVALAFEIPAPRDSATVLILGVGRVERAVFIARSAAHLAASHLARPLNANTSTQRTRTKLHGAWLTCDTRVVNHTTHMPHVSTGELAVVTG